MHKSGRKRTLIPKAKNDKGETITSRKGIVNLFGEFHCKLFTENHCEEEVQDLQNLETREGTQRRKVVTKT